MDTTSAILTLRLCEADKGGHPAQIGEIDAWLKEKGQGRLAPLSERFRLGAGNDALVFGADFEGLDREAFANFVLSRTWARPENVVLVLTPGENGRSLIFQPVDELTD
jgi:hypothetical protein